MNIAIIKNNICIDSAIFDNMQTAQSFFKDGVWDADSIAELPEGFGIGDIYDGKIWTRKPIPTPEPEIYDINELISAKLELSSQMCHEKLTNGFTWDGKNGLQRYRMNDDDQINITGYMVKISFLMFQNDFSKTFDWKNANQDRCEPWGTMEMFNFGMAWGDFKERILKMQDIYKIQIKPCKTKEELDSIILNYD